MLYVSVMELKAYIIEFASSTAAIVMNESILNQKLYNAKFRACPSQLRLHSFDNRTHRIREKRTSQASRMFYGWESFGKRVRTYSINYC